ncbi:MAG: hypothetical protein WCT10_02775 [Patescibacteria group bacterium]|jgi:Tfp pilus assembly protein PilO
MKINKRIVVTISILAGATLLLAGGVAVPTVLAIKDLNSKMAAANAEIDQKYDLRKHTRTSLIKLQQAKELIRTLSSVAVIEGEELEFVSALEKAAEDAGVKQSLVLETVNQRELSLWEKEIPIKIETDGEYRRILVYLHKLERLPYYLTVQSIDINLPQHRESAADGVVKLRLTATVRWLAKNQPVFKQLEYNPNELIEDQSN